MALPRDYPHFYPQADGILLDAELSIPVHNRGGDIFVNNRPPQTRISRQTGPQSNRGHRVKRTKSMWKTLPTPRIP
jgi:hypothetical protein